MNSVVGGTFIGLLFLIWVAVLILPTVFFILTQQRALSKCSPGNQTMSPGLVWLQIIPVFGFIWQFFVVFALANSLGSEFRARRIPEEEKPGQGVGLAMCITRVCVVIPILGIVSLIASVVLWIVYWVKIAGFSRKLDYASAVPPSYLPPGHGPEYPTRPGIGGPPHSRTGLQPPTYPPASRAIAPTAAAYVSARETEETPDPGVPRDCASCGATLTAGAAFCASCGAKTDQTTYQAMGQASDQTSGS